MKHFGLLNVRKSHTLPLTYYIKINQLKSGELASIIICSFIFIVIICVVLFLQYFKKRKKKKKRDIP